MRFSDAFISAYEGCQRYALRGRKRRVPSCAVFHRAYLCAAPVHVFSACLVPDELFTSDRVLSFRKPLEVFFTNFAAQSPLFGELSVPLPTNLVCFGVVVLAGIAKLFRVI